MTISMMKGMALCGLCTVLASLGGAASAQGDFGHGPYHHGPMHHAREAVQRQKADYYRAVKHGNYAAAERAHLRAKAIRHHVRVRREMHGAYGFHRDHGY